MEQKEILAFLDLEDVKDLTELKEKFNNKFTPISDLEDVKKKLGDFTGKHAGSTTTIVKRLAGLENKDIEGKKWEEVVELGFNKLRTQIEELENSKAGANTDEIAKEFQKKIDKITKERDDYKTNHETLLSTYEKEKVESETKFKGFKVGNLFESAKGKVATKLKSDMSLAEKMGFEAALKEINVDFDEKETPIIKDREGKRLVNPNKAGTFLSLDEAIELKANELGLIKKNTGGGQSAQSFFAGQQQQNNNGGSSEPLKSVTGRTIHPSALSHAEKVKASQGG
jgi:hypothetical protein